MNDTWINNIAYAYPGAGVLAGAEPVVNFSTGGTHPNNSSVWINNLTYGGTITTDSTDIVSLSNNLVGIDPMLTNVATHNFVPLAGSPVIGAGQPESFLSTPTPDIGAFLY